MILMDRTELIGSWTENYGRNLGRRDHAIIGKNKGLEGRK